MPANRVFSGVELYGVFQVKLFRGSIVKACLGSPWTPRWSPTLVCADDQKRKKSIERKNKKGRSTSRWTPLEAKFVNAQLNGSDASTTLPVPCAIPQSVARSAFPPVAVCSQPRADRAGLLLVQQDPYAMDADGRAKSLDVIRMPCMDL